MVKAGQRSSELALELVNEPFSKDRLVYTVCTRYRA
jgi:hypothetical protein